MNRRPFDRLWHRLRQRGLSPQYLNRLVDELADHFNALKEAYLSSGVDETEAERLAARDLGDEDSLYEEIVRRKQLVPLIHRYPTLSFILGPVPAVLIAAAIFMSIGTGLFMVATRLLHIAHTEPTFRIIVLRCFYAFAYVLTPVLALVFCHLSTRHRHSTLRALAACLILCLLGGFLKIDLVLCPASGSVKYFLRFGPDVARIAVPLLVFVVHRVLRTVLARRSSAPM